MAVNVTREWLIENGVDAGELDRLLALGTPAPATGRVLVLPGEPRLVRADGGPGRWEAEFHGWRPASKNQKTNRWAWNKARKADDAVLALWVRDPQGPPPAAVRRRVTLHVTRKRVGGRLCDPQNLIESLADSLAANHLLYDDSGRWSSFAEPDLQVDRGLACPVRTVIRLEDL